METIEEPVLACNTYPQETTKENIIEHAYTYSESVLDGSDTNNGGVGSQTLASIETCENNVASELAAPEAGEQSLQSQDIAVEEIVHASTDIISNEVPEAGDAASFKDDQTINETNLITEYIEETPDHIVNETVQFETEVLVEKEETVITAEFNLEGSNDVTNSLLSQLDGQNVDLSGALESTETENTDNNNSSVKQEVFNNEELLDILQGNDLETSKSDDVVDSTDLSDETKIVLQQWKKLKVRSKSEGKTQRKSVRKQTPNNKSKDTLASDMDKEKTPNSTQPLEEVEDIQVMEPDNSKLNKPTEKVETNIVTALVQDWEDDDVEEDKSNKSVEAPNLHNSSEEVNSQQENLLSTNILNKQPAKAQTSPNKVDNDEEVLKSGKSSENGTSQRRLSRVIKKKIIFDPDNPDTFTKGKSAVKTKIPEQGAVAKEHSTPKKTKQEQSSSRDQSKSPVLKMQWKKPTSKNHKTRLTEVDRLLMDEGAVNMIYQLTPEASKGKKNIRTKAELIKKINQNSTPEVVEKKFRERKKDLIKAGDSEPKKGSKQRSSASGSGKLSVGEDFEAHSADDSIIYRRHSSSSYSSSCMSPRRLSDVETASAAAATAATVAAGAAPSAAEPALTEAAQFEVALVNPDVENGEAEDSTFMDDSANTSTEPEIKKEESLSLKEKLKSKLSTVLNKRKRDTSKTDTPRKQKKTLGVPEPAVEPLSDDFKTLTISINFDSRLTEICIHKVGLRNNTVGIEILKDLENALDFVNTRKDTTVTLLTAEFQLFSSGLDLAPLLDDNRDKASNYAFELTSAIRTLLLSMERHSKLLVCGVAGSCEGLGVALAAMCDVTLASEAAEFVLTPRPTAPLVPGVAVLTHYRRLSHSLVNELVLFGGRVRAGEALQAGLASRVLWPGRFADELRAIAKDIAAQPAQTVLLKKQLLGLRARGEREALAASLAAEQDLLVDYWTSAEGRQLLRTHLATQHK